MLVNIYVGDKYITTVDWPQIPDEDERVVIDDIDYKVYSRKWYIYNPNLPPLTSSSEVQIILREI